MPKSLASKNFANERYRTKVTFKVPLPAEIVNHAEKWELEHGRDYLIFPGRIEDLNNAEPNVLDGHRQFVKSTEEYQVDDKGDPKSVDHAVVENFLLFEQWSTKINEDTIEGYEYHFTFEGDDYTIDQGEKDKTIFGIKKKDGDWLVMTKGRLFDPAAHDKTRNEMVKFLQEGIKFFNIRNPVEVDTVKESEWAKFFDFEIKKRPGRINKKYVVLKLHCGKASAKWLSKH